MQARLSHRLSQSRGSARSNPYFCAGDDQSRGAESCVDLENFLRGGGGGGVQIPRRGLTENFNMAKINNLAIPVGGGGGGGGSGPPVPRLWIRP